MAQPVNRGALLQRHHDMMPGQPQAQQDRYRSSAVRGGRYYPPARALVQSLMDDLLRLLRRPPRDNRTLVAAWPHVEIESTHPIRHRH